MKIRNKKLYLVGGAVRDEILGIKSFDTDYCYEGNALDFAKDFEIIKTNPELGTVRIISNKEEIDIASTRTETYPKVGHLPILEQLGCPLKEDLKRRDFTINALAKNTISGEISDYFGGIEDLKNKKIRVLHNKSFIEDPSRIIRALKFAVRLGFELDKETLKLQEEYLSNINYDMSYHRIKKELKETFNLNKKETFDKFIKQNIYKLLGENQKVQNINDNIEKLIDKYRPANIWLVYLGNFDLSRFDLTGEELEIIKSYKLIKTSQPDSDFEIYSLFKNIPLESILLYAVSVNYQKAKHYLENLRTIKPEISGNDLIELGIPQGKIFGEILDFITNKKIENPTMTKKEELELVKGKYL